MLMDNVRYWAAHNAYAAPEAAIRLHHRLVQIHPFPNGNGRHARILADVVLRRVYRERPIDRSGGHELQKMNDRRAPYIAALKAADREDFKALLALPE